MSAAEAVKVIKSGDNIHLSSVASAPQCLINAMVDRGRTGELKNIKIHHLHTEGCAPYANQEFEGIFQHNAFFVGGNVRAAVQSGYADYIPVFLGETQRLYRDGYLPCDVAMIQVCPPNEHGYVSMGTSVDATLAAVEVAKIVIAVINPNVPCASGDAMIQMNMIDIFVEDDTELEPAHFSTPDDVETAIGKHCAALIEDGATLQMGIGAIPNAVLAQLGNHKDLGIHTEMFADGVLPLIEKGVINGAKKVIDHGKIVSTFLMGSQRVYDYIHNNGFKLEKLKYSVLALGDTSYPLFCKTGEEVDEQLNKLGGNRIAPLQKCDVDYDDDANNWFNTILKDLTAKKTTDAVVAPVVVPAVAPAAKKGKQIYFG